MATSAIPVTSTPSTVPSTTPNDSSQFGDYSNWAQQEMAKGFTPAQLQETLKSTPDNASKPSWFERLLPTAGSIIGGIGGEMIDPFGGGIVGASLLGGAGKALENSLTGQKVLQGNDLTSAIEGGVGQGAGDLLSAGLGALTSKGVGSVGDALLSGQFKGALDSDALGSLSNDLGITNATKEVNPIANIVTNKNGFITKGVNTALEDSNKGVDLSGLQDEANRLVAENQTLLADRTGKSIIGNDGVVNHAIAKALSDQPGAASKIGKNGEQLLTGLDENGNSVLKGISPDSGFNVTKDFESLARDALANSGTKQNPVADQAAKYKIFSGLGKFTKDATFGSDADALPISEANRAQMIEDAKPLKDVNEQAYNYFIGKLTAKNPDGTYVLQNAQDLRPLAAPLVRASKVLDDVNSAAFKKGALTAPEIAQAVMGISSNPVHGVIGAVANHLPLEGMATTGLSKIGNLADKTTPDLSDSVVGKLYKSVTGKTIPKDLTDTVSNASKVALRAKQSVIPTTVSQTLSHIPNDVPTANSTNLSGGTTMIPTTTTNATTPDALVQLYNQLLNNYQADPNNASTASTLSALNSLAPQVNKQQLASNSINNLLSTYNNAGGAQGTGGGLISRLTGILGGTPSNTFNAQSGATAAQLASILNISPAEAQAMLPQLMQTQQTATPQISNLQSIINSIRGTGSAIPVQ